MATYAQTSDLDSYAAEVGYQDSIPAAPEDKEALLQRAERDLDNLAFARLPRNPGALKVVLGDLWTEQREGLVRATCAQAVYRVEMGPEHFVRAQRDRLKTRTIDQEGKLPMLGPEASRELSAAGLFQLTIPSHGRGYDDFEQRHWQAR